VRVGVGLPVIGVAISPGATALTVMPCSASSIAAVRVSRPRPALGRAVRRGPDARLVLVHAGDVDDPAAAPGGHHPAAARCRHRKAPSRSVASTSRQSS
jgi:hypothetical protein